MTAPKPRQAWKPKSCPFCGCTTPTIGELQAIGQWRVDCAWIKCGVGPLRSTKSTAVAAWNRRKQ